MSENTKNRWQKRRRHDAHDGDTSGIFCGRAFKTIRTMVLNLAAETLDVSRNTVRKYICNKEGVKKWALMHMQLEQKILK